MRPLGHGIQKLAGAAYVTQRAYRLPWLSFLVGLAIVCSGLTSVATQSRVFSANLAAILGTEGLPVWVLAIGFLLLLAAIVFRGIQESMWVNMVCTAIEAVGLLIVIGAGISFWGAVDYFETPPTRNAGLALLVFQGAVLTFFAFIGFEDTINVAEECRDPQRTVPIGLMLAMGIASVLYVAVAITSVSVVPWRELAEAPGPLTEVMARAAPGLSPIAFTAITLFAVANTALVNYVTASRLLYGMACQGLLPARLAAVHPSTRTPRIAVALLLVILVPLASFGTIGQLASATVLLLLVVFGIVNGALFVLKRRPGERRGKFEVPVIVPALGATVCAALIIVRVAAGDWRAPALAAALLSAICVLYAALRARRVLPFWGL